jgi:tRNA pseudouridine38-40 synthase
VKSDENEGEAELEWVRVRVHGLSFMMHQIRKMIGLAILVLRLDAYSFPTFTSTIPALGLILHHPIFEGYNPIVNSIKKRTVN